MQDTLTKRLIELKSISTQQVSEAQKLARQNGGNLALALVRLGAVSDADYREFLAGFYSCPAIDLSRVAHFK